MLPFVINDNGVLITSDSHLGHENIIRYCGRDYKNARHMDESMIADWNGVVKKDNWVIHLGDFSFNPDRYVNKLNGRIILVRGNHDNGKYDRLFEGVVDHMPLKIGEFNCFLTHKPMDINEQYKKGREPDLSVLDRYDYILCGHVHEKWAVNGKNINVGVDIWKKLITINELVRFLRRVKEEKIKYLKKI